MSSALLYYYSLASRQQESLEASGESFVTPKDFTTTKTTPLSTSCYSPDMHPKPSLRKKGIVIKKFDKISNNNQSDEILKKRKVKSHKFNNNKFNFLTVNLNKTTQAFSSDLAASHIRYSLFDVVKTVKKLKKSENINSSKCYELWYTAVKQAFLLKREITSYANTYKGGSESYATVLKMSRSELYKVFPYLPTIASIASQYNQTALMPTFKDTFTNLASMLNVSESQAKKDCKLFECSLEVMYARYVKYHIKSCKLTICFSTLRKIETIYQKMKLAIQSRNLKIVHSDKESYDHQANLLLTKDLMNKIVTIKDQSFIFLVSGNDIEVYLQESELGKGTYKEVHAATAIRVARTNRDRNIYAILSPLDEPKKVIPAMKAEIFTVATEQPSLSPHAFPLLMPSHSPSLHFERISSGFSPPPLIEIGSPHFDSSCSPSLRRSPSPAYLSSGTPKTRTSLSSRFSSCTNSPKIPSPCLERTPFAQIPPSPILHSHFSLFSSSNPHPTKDSSSVENSQNKSSNDDSGNTKILKRQSPKKLELDDDELYYSVGSSVTQPTDYQKEAAIALALSGEPGIWPTYKTFKIKQKVFMIQQAAGYKTTLTNSAEVTILTLDKFARFVKKKLVTPNDKIVFLGMIEQSIIGILNTHKRGYIHRDIKPENIICSSIGKAGLTDFGGACLDKLQFSKVHTNDILDNPEKRRIYGTTGFLAPEIALWGFDKELYKKISTRADVWSTGIMLWKLLFDKPNHPSMEIDYGKSMTKDKATDKLIRTKLLLESDSEQSREYFTIYPKPLDESSLEHLVWHCTRPDPAERITIEEVLEKFRAWSQNECMIIQSQQ